MTVPVEPAQPAPSDPGSPSDPSAAVVPAVADRSPLRSEAPAAAQPPPAPSGAAPAPAAQVLAHLVPLRRGPDGVHRLTVHLHPEELGQISIIAELRRGDLSVRLAGATEAGREALRVALPELRRELSDAGFGSSTLDLMRDAPEHGPPGRQQPTLPRPGNETARPGGDPAGPPPLAVPARPAGRYGQHTLDLNL